MNLKDYKYKRDFDTTPEPKGVVQKTFKSSLEFVVQKHYASHLHFDFRLEFGGVLKSWAIPKGPSLDPKEKRLAIMVEDHPFEYRLFEGVIPPGNYGAGQVEIWDKGTYFSVGEGNNNEERMNRGFQKGHISFVLDGEKLKGEFALHRIETGNKNWLLIKKEDKHALASHSSSGKLKIEHINGAFKGKPQTPVKPMLSTLVNKPFNKDDWIFELKWDGYRAIAEIEKGEVSFYSRNNQPFSTVYSPIVESLKKIPFRVILDGEIIVLGDYARPNFQLLQNYQKGRTGYLIYYVFDILYFEGMDLTEVPLIQRKELLKKILPKLLNIRYTDHIEKEGEKLYSIAKEIGVEGIMAKNSKSKYFIGQRSSEWLKIKFQKRQEVVIGGFTEPRGSRKGLGALVVGVYKGDDLVYAGHVGGGFDSNELLKLRAKLEKIIINKCPFKEIPKTNASVWWVKPEMVAEIEFSEWTEDGILRKPVVVGIREDKDAKTVVREIPKAENEVVEQAQNKSFKKVQLTNLGKIYFPRDGYLKKDVIEYYKNISSYILPYIKDKPQSLHRFPDGIYGESFYHKNMEEPIPSWLKTHTVYSDSEERNIRYLICNDLETLLYIANLGAIEINTWLSKISNLKNPDFSVIDLDPLETPFSNVIKVARETKKVLDELKITSYIKTSGATGLHIYIPLGARYSFNQSQKFAEIIANLVHSRIPNITSVERSPLRRKGKVYLDFLQNREGQTMAAPYSVRPRHFAPVSTPLFWEELEKGFEPIDFTIKNIFKRLEKYGDVWQGAFEKDKGVDMEKVLKKITQQNFKQSSIF